MMRAKEELRHDSVAAAATTKDELQLLLGKSTLAGAVLCRFELKDKI